MSWQWSGLDCPPRRALPGDPASPEACFKAIVDYESFPEWQDAVKRVEVISRNREGLGEVVAFRID